MSLLQKGDAIKLASQPKQFVEETFGVEFGVGKVVKLDKGNKVQVKFPNCRAFSIASHNLEKA